MKVEMKSVFAGVLLGVVLMCVLGSGSLGGGGGSGVSDWEKTRRSWRKQDEAGQRLEEMEERKRFEREDRLAERKRRNAAKAEAEEAEETKTKATNTKQIAALESEVELLLSRVSNVEDYLQRTGDFQPITYLQLEEITAPQPTNQENGTQVIKEKAI